MTAIQVAVHLPDKNGLPADDTINTFVFATSSSTETAAGLAGLIWTPLQNFYLGGTPTQVDTYIANSIDRGAGKCKMVAYQLAPPGSVTPVTPLGGPVLDSVFTMAGSPAGSDIPRECAVVVTVESPHAGIPEDTPGGVAGPKGDTHPAARRRGRVYVGPCNTGALGSGVNGPGVIADFRAALASSAATMMTEVSLLLGGTCYWGIWSRKNAAIYPITFGHIDDAWDTQRRRGIGATARTTFG